MGIEITLYVAASGDVCAEVESYDEKTQYNLGKDSEELYDFLNCERFQGARIFTEDFT